MTSPPPLAPLGRGPAGIVTGEAVTLDLRPARLPSRLLASGIDLAVQYFGLGLLVTVLGALLGSTGRFDGAAATALVIVIVVLVLLGYPVAMTVFARGRTLGKLALGLRVVREDGGPALFRQVFVRELVGFVVEKPGPLFFLPGILTALLREDSRRIGDLAAGTLVISERVSGGALPPPPMPPPLAGWAAGLDLSRLSDATALRARQLLSRVHDLRPEAREAVGQRLVDEVAAAVGPVPAGTPGWAFLAAVLAERRRRDELRLWERARAAARVPGQPQPGYGLVAAPSRPVGMAAYDQPGA